MIFAAIVTLKDPSLVEDAISKLDNTKLDTLTVSVSVYRSEKILCVAHLPLTMTEYKFREMVVEHGNVDTCFLMRSELTGRYTENLMACLTHKVYFYLSEFHIFLFLVTIYFIWNVLKFSLFEVA